MASCMCPLGQAASNRNHDSIYFQCQFICHMFGSTLISVLAAARLDSRLLFYVSMGRAWTDADGWTGRDRRGRMGQTWTSGADVDGREGRGRTGETQTNGTDAAGRGRRVVVVVVVVHRGRRREGARREDIIIGSSSDEEDAGGAVATTSARGLRRTTRRDDATTARGRRGGGVRGERATDRRHRARRALWRNTTERERF